MADRILVANDSFWYTDDDGLSQLIHKDQRFREGHPAISGRESFFKEDSVFELEEAPTAKPRAGRPRKTT